ncbi:MarR family transcriptional regulator [Desulfosporosinus sp. PR]|uniref:MarR family winged helix-turn-helix transcriptional regulator n=1 Tax=Candidatus Desulfosporosinus nitrosoreducens TaxID=3401928 RepID=UPI0027F90C0C|nr:MarR family transcriptional regulator [Desulfosporosinus sp. PR]MDQ7093595.1 MarR family transcriptional regulator [Desulfosporosinus sp. PR]
MKKRDWEYPYDLFIKGIAQKMRLLNEQKLKEYHLTAPQALLLEILERLIRRGMEISRKNLQVPMNLKGSSVTNLLNGLEKKGCIIRSTGLTDGRTFQIQVTEKGLKLVREMETIFAATENRLLQGMSGEEKQLFLNLLLRAYENLEPEG